MTKDVIKGLGDLLHLVAPRLEGLYDISVRVGGIRGPATMPRAGSIPRAGERRRTAAEDAREPAVDLFDEGDIIIVVVQLPGIEQGAVHWSFRDSRHLTIRGGAADRNFHKELPLPSAVDEAATVSSFANGVLELRLWKRQ